MGLINVNLQACQCGRWISKIIFQQIQTDDDTLLETYTKQKLIMYLLTGGELIATAKRFAAEMH